MQDAQRGTPADVIRAQRQLLARNASLIKELNEYRMLMNVRGHADASRRVSTSKATPVLPLACGAVH